MKKKNEENKNEYLRYKSELLQQYVVSNIQNKINESLKEKGLDPNSKEGEEAAQSMTPPEIEIFMKRKYSTTVEKAANSILNKLMKQLLLKEKFSKNQHLWPTPIITNHLKKENKRLKTKNSLFNIISGIIIAPLTYYAIFK